MTTNSEDGSKSFCTPCADFRKLDEHVKEIRPAHPPETTGARDGNRTHDPSLTKTVRYRCATRAKLYSSHISHITFRFCNGRDKSVPAKGLKKTCTGWAVEDSNLRSFRN